MSLFRKILKVVIAVVAVIYIGLVFLTDDYTAFIPSLLERFKAAEETEVESEAEAESVEEEAAPTAANAFSFDPETLVYDGTGSLNLLEGVSFGTLTPEEIRTGVFAEIKPGTSKNAKVISYSVKTDSGTVKADRPLTLENYSGPMLALPAAMPEVSLSTLESMGARVVTSEGFVADDGYGNNIGDSLVSSVEIDPTDITNITYNFSLSNMFGDTAYAGVSVSPVIDLPFIELITAEVTCSPSNPFTGKYANVKRVIDTDGSSIGAKVRCEGEVNTEVPGTYILTYTVTNDAGLSALPVSLVVHITE